MLLISRCFHPQGSTSIPSNFVVLSYRDTIVPFRNEKAIAGVEKKNSIRFRWKENDATFKNALERLTAKMRSNELMTLHKMASERVFLLELKAKYAGLHAITLIKHHLRRVGRLPRELYYSGFNLIFQSALPRSLLACERCECRYFSYLFKKNIGCNPFVALYVAVI